MTVTTFTRQYPLRVVGQIVNNHLRISSADGELYDNAVRCVCNAIDAAEDYINMPICRTAVLIEGVAEPGVLLPLNVAYAKPTLIKVNGEEVRDGECVVNGCKVNSYVTISSAYAGGVVLSIEAEVGYDDNTLPGAIYQAVALMAGTFFEFRADNLSGTITSELPRTAESLLNPYRVYPYEL